MTRQAKYQGIAQSRYTEEEVASRVRSGIWDSATLSDLWAEMSRNPERPAALADPKWSYTNKQAWATIRAYAGRIASLGLDRSKPVVIQNPNCAAQLMLRVACELAGHIAAPLSIKLGYWDVCSIIRSLGSELFVLPPNDLLADSAPRSGRWPSVEAYFMQVYGDKRYLAQELYGPGELLPPKVRSPVRYIAHPTRGDLELAPLYDDLSAPEPHELGALPSTAVSLLLHTSGSTGAPRMVEHAICHRIAQWRRNAELLDIGPDDLVAALSPHPGGVSLPVFVGAAVAGARVFLSPGFDGDKALPLLAKLRCTVATVVPAQLAMLLCSATETGKRLRRMRYWWCAGSSLDAGLAAEVESRIGGKVVPVYGATDWGGECIGIPSLPQAQRLGSVGRPVDGGRIRVVGEAGEPVHAGETGEVQGTGPNCVSGYWNDKEATKEKWTDDGWCRTGDIGRIDSNGNLVIVGRRDDMIIRGGQNIFPEEVERIIRSHPGVEGAAIVGIPDKVLGQKVCALVAFVEGVTLGVAELRSWVTECGAAAYKAPDVIIETDRVCGMADGKQNRAHLLDETMRAAERAEWTRREETTGRPRKRNAPA